MHRFAATVQVEPRPHIWLDIGTREGPQILRDVENFRDVLVKKGWQLDRDLHYERVEGAEHNEAAWSQRVGPVLQFLFPAGNKKRIIRPAARLDESGIYVSYHRAVRDTR